FFGFRPMDLQQVEIEFGQDLRDEIARGFDEHSDHSGASADCASDFARRLQRNEAWTACVEVESDEINAEFARGQRVLNARKPADFDLNQRGPPARERRNRELPWSSSFAALRTNDR